MTPTGALVLALVALIVLGSFAAWLLNVPLLAIGVLAALAGRLCRWVLRRWAHGRARQDTEASH